MEALVFLLVTGSISGFIGWLIAKGKGRGKAGFWWSFFLGIIGWIIAACLEPSREVRRERMAEDAAFLRNVIGDDK